MNIRKLTVYTLIFLSFVSSLVIGMSIYFIKRGIEEQQQGLQDRYIDSTIEIFREDLVGAILLEDTNVLQALLREIAIKRNVYLELIYKTNKISEGVPSGAIKTTNLEINGLNLGTLSVSVHRDLQTKILPFNVIVLVLLQIVILVGGFYLYFKLLTRKLIQPLAELASNVKKGHYNSNLVLGDPLDEVKLLFGSLKEMSEKLNIMARTKAMSEVAQQVAHDIRSPLSALNMVATTLDQVPEERRVLIRNSIQRINDIANSLLQKSKTAEVQHQNTKIDKLEDHNSNFNLKIELLPALVDTIVSEKRIQFRDQINVSVEVDITASYGAFANVDSAELKRVISNLINNSVEAFPNQSGKVLVSIKKAHDSSHIIISDNGRGIPVSVLERLGQMGVSHGKEGTQSGSGLGVYHAKKAIETFGGVFKIESQESKGTTITMGFPKVNAPNWFVEKLVIPSGVKIISVDDDLSIHGIWKGRVQSLGIGSYGIEHLSFTSGDEFKKWYLNEPKKENLFLIDYELLGQSKTGLDLIEDLKIAGQSILVTSRYEEEKIRERCQRLGVKLIPKTMAGFVPIVLS